MKLYTLLLALVALVAVAVCDFWDPTQMFNIMASDTMKNSYDNARNDLLCAMRGSDRAAGIQLWDTRTPPSCQSMWNSNNWHKDRLRWFWFEVATPPLLTDFAALGWSAALTDIAAPASSWNFQRYMHANPGDARPIETQEYTAFTVNPNFPYPSAKRKATGAYMDLARERFQGVLIAQSYVSPAEAAKRHWTSRAPEASPIQGNELPQLRKLSDFLWAFWKKQRTLDSARNLRWYGAYNAHNRVTLALIARFLGERGHTDLEDWPAQGSEFPTNTPQGRALLASPVGIPFSLLLINHKVDLGPYKHVTSVKVFKGPILNGHYYPQLLFKIEMVPANMIYPDPGAPPPPPPGDPDAGPSDGSMSGGDHVDRRSGSKNVLRVHRLG